MLRSGCIAQIAVRAWSGISCGTLGAVLPCGTATISDACSCESTHFASRGFSHALHSSGAAPARDVGSSDATSSGSSLSWAGAAHAATFSTTAAIGAAAGATRPSRRQAERQLLQPVADLPPEAHATLADELDARRGSRAQAAAASGRRARRLPPTAQGAAGDGAAAASSPASAGSAESVSELDDAEVRAVFDKLVGGMTKSGRKATARRIVLDAMRVMRQHLRKGSLEELK